MLLSTRIKLVLALWFVGEALLFVLVVKLIGFLLAFLLGVATSLVGASLLKRAGAAAMTKFRAALDSRRVDDGQPGRMLDDTLATIGALALLLPGFLSDLVGAILLVPMARDHVTAWVERSGLMRFGGGDGRRHAPSTIDLSPDEWQRSEPPPRRVSEI